MKNVEIEAYEHKHTSVLSVAGGSINMTYIHRLQPSYAAAASSGCEIQGAVQVWGRCLHPATGFVAALKRMVA